MDFVCARRFVPVIGLVGGVGSGKSSLARELARRGRVEIVDGDQAGHDVLTRPEVKERIRRQFGESVLTAAGEIDRGKMARLVFGDSAECRRHRKVLEDIVHPEIRKELERQIAAARGSSQCEAVLLDAAVLFEAGWSDLCDAVVFVDAPLGERLQRVAAGRGWSERDLALREASQWPLQQKQARSQFTIENSGAFPEAVGRLEGILEQVLKNRTTDVPP